jgi:membrane protease YdiL (CAAX protease family)
MTVNEDRRHWEIDARAFGAAAALALPFTALLLVLALRAPPDPSQHAASDPLVQLLGRMAVWWIVAAAAIVGMGWNRIRRVERRDVVLAIAGAGAAIVIACALRATLGEHLPSFVPPEESNVPGVTLGLAAGLVEEVAFRLIILPAAYFTCRKRLDARLSAAIAIVITAALFALSHELGPAGGAFEPRFLLTRFLIPGVAMSLLAFVPGPSFIVSAHCTAHLLIPVLFRR